MIREKETRELEWENSGTFGSNETIADTVAWGTTKKQLPSRRCGVTDQLSAAVKMVTMNSL